ncbi:MAG TPA: Wzz/FepE/Etk N-terminal domain-containing protein [Terriglobia bacterium]|nr:Wzz/FepE/Etk N-terminal domain-containing protein [Terriglobia bacterium]
MPATRELGFDDYIKVLRRRLKVILVPALIGAALGYLLTLVLTPEYTSESLILIQRPSVPQDLVPQVTTDDLFARLAAMEERIESRSRLQPLIERYDLYTSQRKRSTEEAVDEMRKDIRVRETSFQDPSTKNNQKQSIPGFSIEFTAESARLAQQVCTELTSMFMSENLQQHEQAAKQTTDFLTGQLADAKRRLDEQDASLAEFKTKNLGALPNDTQANLQVLASLNTQLAAVTDQINRAQQNRAYEQTLLADQEAQWKSTGSNPENADTLTIMKAQLAKLRNQLTILQGRYTDDYPDVVKTKKDIAELETEIDAQQSGSVSPSATKAAPGGAKATASAEPAGAGNPAISGAGGASAPKSSPTAVAENSTPSGPIPPAIQQLRATLKQDDIFITQKTKQQEKLQRQIRAYEGRLQVSPEVEEEYNKLSLGRDAALKFYNTLVASRDASQMSVNLDTQGQGETFQILDTPDLPQNPSFPVWWQFSVGGLVLGLMIGIVVAAIFELGDKSLRDEQDIEFYLGLPTLALVPSIDSENGARKNGRHGILRRRKQKELTAATPAAKVSA